jgi:hypothetical protein
MAATPGRVPEMAIIPFGEYLPDMPTFGSAGTATALNVVPRSQQSYTAMPSPVPSSSPLPARVCGSYGYRDASGHVANFAATQQRIYTQVTGQTDFTDVSGPGAPYNTDTPPDGYWQMTSFGQRIIATNYNDPIQTYLAGADTEFSDLSAAAPRAKFCAVIRDFLMLGNTYDSRDGAVQYRLAWPAIGDPTNWPVPGTNVAIELQSDYQDLVQTDMGAITQVVGGHLSAADGAALCERGIYRIQYAGSPAIFDFAVAEGAAGTDASLSVVTRRLANSNGTVNAVIYYLATDGFYAFDGSSSTPIGAQKIDRTFFADLDVQYLRQVQGTWDPSRKLILWFYHGAANHGLFNRALIYNWEVGRWSLIELTAIPVEWAEPSTYSTLGYNLEELDPFGNLEQLSFSLDSLAWTQGNPLLGWFDSNHRQNYTTGPSMAATLDTTEQQLFPDRRARITGARPLHDAIVPANVAVGTREMVRQSVVYQGAVPENILGNCPQRCTGRYVRFRMILPAGANFRNLQGVDVAARPEGIR